MESLCRGVLRDFGRGRDPVLSSGVEVNSGLNDALPPAQASPNAMANAVGRQRRASSQAKTPERFISPPHLIRIGHVVVPELSHKCRLVSLGWCMQENNCGLVI